MTHEEQRRWLIGQLIKEHPEAYEEPVPDGETAQKNLLRALMNVRPPAPVSEEFLRIQNEYLTEETTQNGITDAKMLQPVETDQRIILWQGDITRLKVGAIVNAANSEMLGCFVPLHACIDNCIHTFSGVQLRNECAVKMRALRKEHGADYFRPTAVPMLTDAYNLPCDNVIHVVGPIVQDELTSEHERLLEACYSSCLDLALEHGIASIAFCCISTGVFRFPNERAAEIAVGAVKKKLDESSSNIQVIFNVFKESDLRIYQKLLA